MKILHTCLLSLVGLALSACAAELTNPDLSGAPYDDEAEATDEKDPDALGLVNAALSSRDLSVPWVGMVPGTIADQALPACPDGYEYIKFDDEDSSNNNQLTVKGKSYNGRNVAVGGIQRVPSPRRAGGNTKLTYCKKQVSALPSLAYDYAVISASDVCPAGSYRFSRRWDNEDSGNHNASSADIASNSTGRSSNGWSWINFCFVPAASGAPVWDSSFDGWIIWTAQDLSPYGYVSGSIYTDDEDKKNNNQYKVITGADFTSRMQSIVSAGSNTRMGFAAKALVVHDYGTKDSCDDSNYEKVAVIFYGAADILYQVFETETPLDLIVWAASSLVSGVGLAIEAVCWY